MKYYNTLELQRTTLNATIKKEIFVLIKTYYLNLRDIVIIQRIVNHSIKNDDQ